MTSAAISNYPIARNQQPHDDLTMIKGIGAARQQWLQDSFTVRRFEDLAALTVEEIEAQLKVSGKIASRSDISHWLKQAQELVPVTE